TAARLDRMQLRDRKLLEFKNEFSDEMNLAEPVFFPNALLIQINNSLATRQIRPQGVSAHAVFETVFGYADDDAAMTLDRLIAVDEDRLEDWVELFDEDCDYRIVTRENVEQGLPNVLMWCDNKNMLRDRVESYRNVNLYNPHYDRHVIGPLRFTDKKDSIFCF